MFPDFESGAYKREAETSVTLDNFFAREDIEKKREDIEKIIYTCFTVWIRHIL